MLKVAIIITAMGEKEKASECMAECQRQTDSLVSEEKYSFSIFMNTQGSIGLESTWSYAAKEKFDFYIFMDSDFSLAENAISTFLENSEFLRHRAIIAGTVSRGGEIMFGGRTRRGRIVEPDPVIPVPCHLFDIDLVMIPEYAFSVLENPSDLLRMSLLDYGYGKSAAKAGVARVVAPGVLARTSRKIEIPAWKNPEIGLWERIASLNQDVFQRLIRALKASV